MHFFNRCTSIELTLIMLHFFKKHVVFHQQTGRFTKISARQMNKICSDFPPFLLHILFVKCFFPNKNEHFSVKIAVFYPIVHENEANKRRPTS